MFRRALGLALLLALPAAAPTRGADASTGFPAQVKDHFARWDRNKDGTLSRDEIDRLVADPAVKGPEAAAVVALKRAVRNIRYTLPPLTRNTLAELAAKRAKDGPDLNGMYATALGKITKSNRELFAAGGPSLDHFSQGKLGDCFCLAPLGAMVCREPKDVVRMIRPQADGSYKVRLGAKDVTVPALTDAELALTGTAGPGGVWVNVYEKAVGLHRKAEAGADSPSPIDLLGKGGSAGTMVGVVTGHPIERFSCKFAKDPATTPAERDAKLAELRSKLTAAFTEKRLVTCGTATGVTTPGVNGNHAYAVTGYDPKTDEILLWNPHGQSFTPKGAAGIEHGYPTKGGRFRVPLPEYVRVFAGLAFEVTPAG
jgi:hypothetical protein